jgi:uncharacterized protein YjbI with pentapeptide repeats
MDELMQEARFYKLNGKNKISAAITFICQTLNYFSLNVDLLKLRWDNLPIITQGILSYNYRKIECHKLTYFSLEQLYKLYPPAHNNTQYRPIIMQLTKKNLSNLDFSNYHIDPRSSFIDSNLENAQFIDAKFGFDFDHQVDFSYTFLVGATFPKEGSTNRASGVQMKLGGAILE